MQEAGRDTKTMLRKSPCLVYRSFIEIRLYKVTALYTKHFELQGPVLMQIVDAVDKQFQSVKRVCGASE